MIVINLKGTTGNKPKPLLASQVRVLSKSKQKASDQQRQASEKTAEEEQTGDPVIAELAAELREILMERDKLSRKIAPMVRNHQKGHTPIADLEQLYHDIEQLTKAGSKVYQKLDYYQKNDELPVEESPGDLLETDDMLALNQLKRSLENRRSKVSKNIESFYNKSIKPKNPSKILEWERTKLELDDQYQRLIQKLKSLKNA